jgi:pilus assembly protein CpaE
MRAMQKKRFYLKDSRDGAGPLERVNGSKRPLATSLRHSLKPQAPIRTIAFHGGKGGVGVTFFAAETAAALASAGLSVAAVDMDLYRGTLHYRLDVPLSRDTFTVVDVLPVLEDLTDRVLDNALARCPCGARLLPAPATPERAGLVTSEHVRALVSALSTNFDFVVLDTPASLDEVTAGAARQADLLVLIVTPELSCLGGAKRALETLGSRGADHSRVAVVVNRSFGDSDSVTLADIESFLGLPPVIVLPEETERCRRIADEGKYVFLERSPLGQGVQAMISRFFSRA